METSLFPTHSPLRYECFDPALVRPEQHPLLVRSADPFVSHDRSYDDAADLYRQATLLLSRGDYRLAFPMMLEAAALGDAEALRITGSGSPAR